MKIFKIKYNFWEEDHFTTREAYVVASDIQQVVTQVGKPITAVEDTSGRLEVIIDPKL